MTGVVCAVLGHEDGDGKFLVDDYCWAGVSEPVQRPLQSGDDRYNIFFKYHVNAGWRYVHVLCQIRKFEFFFMNCGTGLHSLKFLIMKMLYSFKYKMRNFPDFLIWKMGMPLIMQKVKTHST